MHEQAELLLRPVRAQQPTWPHSWRPLQLVMQDDALRYKQGKREVAIPLHHVTHVNVVDNERCVVATLSLSLAPRTAPLNTFPLPLYALPRWPPLTHSHPTPFSPHPPASAPTSTHHTPHTAHHTPHTSARTPPHPIPEQVRVRHTLSRPHRRLPCGGRLCNDCVGGGAAEQGAPAEPHRW